MSTFLSVSCRDVLVSVIRQKKKKKKYKKVEPLNPKICLECPLGNVHEILYYIATIIILVRTL